MTQDDKDKITTTQGDKDKIEATPINASGQKSLELLFEYTKFHIGVYLTLTASYVTVVSIKSGTAFALNINHCLVWPAILCFMVAGLAGGIIASSITQTQEPSSNKFLEQEIGPWEIERFRCKARIWTWIEHTAFWAGLILAVLSVHP